METKPECVEITHDTAVNDASIAFFKCHSLEHARHVLRREWFKRVHKAIIKKERKHDEKR